MAAHGLTILRQIRQVRERGGDWRKYARDATDAPGTCFTGGFPEHLFDLLDGAPEADEEAFFTRLQRAIEVDLTWMEAHRTLEEVRESLCQARQRSA